MQVSQQDLRKGVEGEFWAEFRTGFYSASLVHLERCTKNFEIASKLFAVLESLLGAGV